MKKVLFATTALALSAGVAAADFKIGGTSYAGIQYNSNPAVATTKTRVNTRLRFNIDASKQLDSGVTLGGRIRLQSDHDSNSRTAATLNMAQLYATSGGLRVEVGNSSAAVDAMSLIGRGELGYIGTIQGGKGNMQYAGYQSRAYSTGNATGTPNQADRMGVYVAYTVGDIVARASYITPNQVSKTAVSGAFDEELALSFDYKSGPFAVGVGYANNGNFVKNNDVFIIYGEYAINSTTRVGLQYMDNGKNSTLATVAPGADRGRTVVLYGNTTLSGGIGLGAFISNVDSKALTALNVSQKTAYGIGASYDLGGATLAGTIQRTHTKATYADLGINFAF
ncbi:MAG: porin [Gemmobacter sp.]